MGYVVKSSTKYYLHIGATGGTIYAPSNSSGLFKDFSACTVITNFNLLDTSNVTNMQSFFEGCSKLDFSNMDFSNFTTTNVVNMNSIFKGCSSANSLEDISLVTSLVTDARYMFSDAKFDSLDLTSFLFSLDCLSGHSFRL